MLFDKGSKFNLCSERERIDVGTCSIGCSECGNERIVFSSHIQKQFIFVVCMQVVDGSSRICIPLDIAI